MINQIIWSLSAAVFAVMIVCMIVGMKFASSISKNIRTSINAVGKIAAGDLTVWVDDRMLKQKDETGDLSRVTITLRDAMQETIKEIDKNARTLLDASRLLQTAADNTSGTMENVRTAVNHVVDNSAEQAENSRNTSEHMRIMGENITETTSEVKTLDENAVSMQQSSEKAAETLHRLQNINSKVEDTIHEVQEQTNRTNESVKRIQAATEFITSIAEETNLLSLNASIEAARAGESGKGFAVVAGQIKKLSEQSNQSSKEIEETAKELQDDSSKAVEIMEEMQKIIISQSESMSETQKVVEEVISQCIIAVNKWDAVEKDGRTMDTFRKKLMQDFSFMSYAPIIFISAKTGQRIDRLFELICYVDGQNAMRISTGKLNDVLAAATARVQPPTDKGRRLKIYYMTQASTRPPTFVCFVNRKDLFHYSYQRYLDNQIREVFGLEGTPTRFVIREREERK